MSSLKEERLESYLIGGQARFYRLAYSYLQDREEALEGLCPACRSRALEEHCALCGQPAPQWGAENAAFDLGRFMQLKEGSGA